MLSLMDHLTLREQLKLLEIATEASSMDAREHALAILNQYRKPPIFKVPPDIDENQIT